MKILCFCLLSLALASADDITTTDGKTYKNAKIVSHDASFAVIMYDDGGATVEITKLPASLQSKLGYDPAKDAAEKAAQMKIAAGEKEAAARRKQRAAQIASAVSLDGWVIQKENDGVLLIQCDEPVRQSPEEDADSALRGNMSAVTFSKSPRADTAPAPAYGTFYLRDAGPHLIEGDHVLVQAYPSGDYSGTVQPSGRIDGTHHAYTVITP